MTLFAVQWMFSIVVGGSLGFVLGRLLTYDTRISGPFLHFLRYAQWFPYIITWSLPVWPPHLRYATMDIALIWIISCFAVTLAAMYRYLLLRAVLVVTRRVAIFDMIREVMLKGLFIALVAQIWMQPYGWRWFVMIDENWQLQVLLNLVLLVLMLLSINLVTRADLDELSARACRFVCPQSSLLGHSTVLGALLLTAICLVAWYVFGGFLIRPAALDVIRAAANLLELTAPKAFGTEFTLLYHVSISFIEVVSGLSLAAMLASILARTISERSHFRKIVTNSATLTFVVPFLLSVLPLGWPRPVRISFGVMLISFYPCIELMWQGRRLATGHLVLVAVAEALPFAFLGMLIGESMFSEAGLFHVIVKARAQAATYDAAVALTLISFVFIVAGGFFLRWMGCPRLQDDGVQGKLRV